jgi:hypothetical protein
MRAGVGPALRTGDHAAMTRIRLPVALLAGSMAVLAVVSLVALPAAAADLPFGGPANADGTLTVAPFAVNLAGAMPGDHLVSQSIAVPASHVGPYRLRAVPSGSDLLATAILVRVTTSGGALLYDGPLAGAAVTGEAPAAGDRLDLSLRLDAAAGNEVQGQQLAVSWTLQVTSGLD